MKRSVMLTLILLLSSQALALGDTTGKAVGIPDESPNWIILIGLITIAIIGIILFFRKPKPKEASKIEPPQVIRKILAKPKT